MSNTYKYSILQFYNSSILHEHARYQKTQTMTIDQCLHIFNSTILQFFDSTRTCTLPKNSNYDHGPIILPFIQFYNSTILHENTHHQNANANYDHWLLLAYIQFYNSTILRFYMKTHVTKKNSNYNHWLLLTYIQFYNSTILRFYMKTHVTKNFKQ